ncbi:WYL domain-containing protein [Streptomyces sp. NBC_01378]|uniref:WYL domain-containing protein n=1 Tax=Streptomyces sp. NBC_01378 TaxID=2903844 RepID=UPI00386CA502
MLETSARPLRPLSLLRARREWSGAGLADRLGVTPRSVRRDADRLRGDAPRPGPSDVDPSVLTELARPAGTRSGCASPAWTTGARTSRTVEPHRLVYGERRWYLVAWDVDREDRRTFPRRPHHAEAAAAAARAARDPAHATPPTTSPRMSRRVSRRGRTPTGRRSESWCPSR